MKTQVIKTKPEAFNAVQVTKKNIEEAARWCDGYITRSDVLGDLILVADCKIEYYKSRVGIGDWVIEDESLNFTVCAKEDFSDYYSVQKESR